MKELQRLQKILCNLNRVEEVVKKYNLESLDKLSANKDACDLCVFYMAQISSVLGELCEDTKKDLSSSTDLGVFENFTKIIEEDYGYIRREEICEYIKSVLCSRFKGIVTYKLDTVGD